MTVTLTLRHKNDFNIEKNFQKNMLIYVNELFETASLKTCVRLSNEYVLNTNTIVYGLMVEYALHKI